MKWKNDYSEDWVKHFALFPTSLENGKTVWLIPYWRRYKPINKGAGCACGSHIFATWEYTDVEPTNKVR